MATEIVNWTHTEGISFTDRHVCFILADGDGYQGSIVMARIDDDTTWGERRQTWGHAILGPDLAVLDRNENALGTLKSGVDANPHPLLMLQSLLHFLEAAVEAVNRPASENHGLFTDDACRWASHNDKLLLDADMMIEEARDNGGLVWPVPDGKRTNKTLWAKS